jgi:hypothetical protein
MSSVSAATTYPLRDTAMSDPRRSQVGGGVARPVDDLGFYTTAAQVIPVLWIVIAVEPRLGPLLAPRSNGCVMVQSPTTPAWP